MPKYNTPNEAFVNEYRTTVPFRAADAAYQVRKANRDAAEAEETAPQDDPATVKKTLGLAAVGLVGVGLAANHLGLNDFDGADHSNHNHPQPPAVAGPHEGAQPTQLPESPNGTIDVTPQE